MIREDKKLSQEYIAHKHGFSQSQYSRRECGSIKFIPDELRKLWKVFEIPIADLFDKVKKLFSIQARMMKFLNNTLNF